jgi:hypothetical protein
MIPPKLLILSLNVYGKKHTIQMPDTCTLEELYDAFNSLLIGMTYNQKSIDNHIIDRADSLERYNPENED